MHEVIDMMIFIIIEDECTNNYYDYYEIIRRQRNN
jgi:hypothetical protein